MSIRNLVLAGTIALGAALSAGTANASPATDLAIGIPTSTESSVTQAYYPGGYYPGYGKSRLCYVPFFKLVQYFGYWQARQIKRRCYFTPYYGYKGYNKY